MIDALWRRFSGGSQVEARPARPYRRLDSERWLKRLMKGYYLLTQVGPRIGLKTAWLTSGAPVEVALAMGVIPQYPENYGALCGARRVAVDLCQVAEAAGYSPDLCSYARSDLGSILAPDRAPMGGLTRPDMLIACNNICGTVIKWWEHLAHRLGVPLFLLDTPFTRGERPEHLLRYAEAQLSELVSFLEEHTGKRFDEGRLVQTAARSSATLGLWNACLQSCSARPAPMGCADRFLAMAPVVTMRGTRTALDYYHLLYRELGRRVDRGEGAVREERRRLLWDNIAIWYDIHGIFNRFAEAGFSFPVDTYTSAWTGAISPEEPPLRAIARIYSSIYLNQDMPTKVEVMTRMIRRFDLDGFVLHSNRSCKPYSLGQQVIRRQLTERTGKPGLVIEADMADSRHYDRRRVASQISTFIEVLA